MIRSPEVLAPTFRQEAWVRTGLLSRVSLTPRPAQARTALRISPGNPYNDMSEPDPHATYLALAEALRPLGMAYLHMVETGERDLTRKLRAEFGGLFMLNPRTAPGHTGPEHLVLVEDGTTDLLSYGALFLANPDLPHRLAAGGPFNAPDRARFYGGDERGFTDYPTLPELPA